MKVSSTQRTSNIQFIVINVKYSDISNVITMKSTDTIFILRDTIRKTFKLTDTKTFELYLNDFQINHFFNNLKLTSIIEIFLINSK